MSQVLLAIGVFWVIASVQLGGLIDAENGSGLQQFLGLIVTLVLYMAVFFGLRAVTAGLPSIAAFAVPLAIPLLALGWLARIGFRLVGVKIVSAPFADAPH
ncbi:MAG: hypothetical protein OEU54_01920 [Gemmatimonadota bacterium]|nr:hypothetical protein [Gemmatimonadota bacterium]